MGLSSVPYGKLVAYTKKTVRVFDEKEMCTLDTQTGSVPRTITEKPELKARVLTKMTTLRSLI